MGESWVGGDIGGLWAMAATMIQTPQEMDGVVHALSSGVNELVSDVGWSGSAAEAFRNAWSGDALTAGTLSQVVRGVATTVQTLADTLAEYDRLLRSAAEIAMAAGVPIDDTGTVLPYAVPDPPDAKATATMAAAATHAHDVMVIRQQAQQARVEATRTLGSLLDQLTAEPPVLPKDGYVSGAALLRSLLVAPNEADALLVASYDRRMRQLRDVRVAAKAEVDAARAGGQAIGPGDPLYGEYRDAINKIKTFDQDAAAARAGRSPAWMDVLNSKVGDLRAIEALEAAGKLPKFLEFAKELPVLDIAASAGAAGLQTVDDTQKGWSLPHAVTIDFGAAAAGIGAGIGATALAVSAPVTVPTTLVVVGAGAVAFGVGDLVYQGFHEHWREDIHQHGVVGGILTGVENSADRVGTDVKNISVELGNDAKNAGEAVWGWITG